MKTSWSMLFLVLLLAGCTRNGEVTVTGAWVRAAPPGAGMTAAYLVVRNDSADTITITGAASPEFDNVQLHRTEVVEGTARMRHVPELELAPGERAALEPGGLHLMLMGAERMPGAGEAITLSVLLGDGREFTVQAPVQPDAP